LLTSLNTTRRLLYVYLGCERRILCAKVEKIRLCGKGLGLELGLVLGLGLVNAAAYCTLDSIYSIAERRVPELIPGLGSQPV